MTRTEMHLELFWFAGGGKETSTTGARVGLGRAVFVCCGVFKREARVASSRNFAFTQKGGEARNPMILLFFRAMASLVCLGLYLQLPKL